MKILGISLFLEDILKENKAIVEKIYPYKLDCFIFAASVTLFEKVNILHFEETRDTFVKQLNGINAEA